MNPINGLSSLIEILRRQTIEHAKKLGKTKPRGGSESGAEVKQSKLSIIELKSSIRDRIKGLDKNDLQYQNDAGRIFLESVLAWEFGNDILNDRRFNELVTDIYTTLNLNKKTQHSLETALNELNINTPV